MAGPLTLAQRPTPLHRLNRLSEWLGADVWVKRDDLTGFGLSGNKVRKLDWLMADAQSLGADTVITTGGLQSNHCRATAVSCRQLGLDPVLLLRGEAPGIADGNVLLDQLLSADVHYCTPDEYRRHRTERMEALAAGIRSHGGVPYIIPEGGSNAVGSQGYIAAGHELLEQSPAGFDTCCVAVGSGGTLAGLALGPDIGTTIGFAVCDDAAFFSAKIHEIAVSAADQGIAGPLRTNWHVNDAYRGEAYGVAGPEVWETIATVAKLEGLFLDPVYTGKAMHGLISEIQAGHLGGRVLFWHTGGGFGLFGRGHEVPR